MNYKITVISIFILGAAIGGAGSYLFLSGGGLSASEAGKIAIDFINKSIEQNNVTADLLGAVPDSGVYKIHLKIEDQEYDSFITKDGKYLFSSAFIMQEEKVPESSQQTDSLAEFAKCLTDSGAKFYGAFWCTHCKAQKEMFGEAAQYLPYVECSTEDGKSQLAACKDKNIISYPTWEFADGSRESGEVPLQKLAEKTGCQLPAK